MAIVFQTTFDIPEWIKTLGAASTDTQLAPAGDTIRSNGAWDTSNGSLDQIVSAANNPLGSGRGFRHWVGDGSNDAGGGIQFDVVPGVSEMWFRYYCRFQLGFAWGGTTEMKQIYVNRGQPGTFYFGLKNGDIGGHIEVEVNHTGTASWADWQGGSTGDGLWHCVEIHCKMNTIGGVADGVWEMWLDGTNVYSNSAVKWSNSTGATWSNIAMGENHNNPQNGGVDVYIDFDDVVISNSGYIGPISAGGSQRHRHRHLHP